MSAPARMALSIPCVDFGAGVVPAGGLPCAAVKRARFRTDDGVEGVGVAAAVISCDGCEIFRDSARRFDGCGR